MNGRKAKKIRKVAKQICEGKFETKYMQVREHPKMYRQQLSKAEMKKRESAGKKGTFSLKGFLEGGKMSGDVLTTMVTVSQQVLDPTCFRAKYVGLKKNWDQVVANVPVMAKL